MAEAQAADRVLYYLTLAGATAPLYANAEAIVHDTRASTSIPKLTCRRTPT
ncbi:MAG: hypothetical protein IT318_11235 [Anaerolineales bacterium]|nr:hypothetical protein [Anaerolineales bacterium]